MMTIEQKHNEYLTLTLKGFFGVILPFTHKIKIPYSEITQVLTDTVKTDKTKTIKFIGVSMGNRNIGIFYVVGKGKVFYAFYRKNKCITLKLRNNYKYKEVIVEVEDKERVARDIIKYLPKNN
jgi:Bacterial PH domain